MLEIYIILSQFLMVDKRWAMMKEVLPFNSSFKAVCTIFSVLASMEEVASSKIRILGSARRVLAKEISCRWPWDSREPRSLTSVM